jgi:hypothetical protein
MALQESMKELKANENELTEFIKKDEEDTQIKTAQMDNEIKNRKDKENKIKSIESDISSLKSEISKNLDTLHTQEEHKLFLSQLGQYSNHFAEMEEERLQKKAQKMKEWIMFHKKNSANDHVIFRQDDESMDD